MTTVTFPNNNTYNDGSTPPGNMDNGGHRTNFLPMIADVILIANSAITAGATATTQAGIATTQASNALASANSASASAATATAAAVSSDYPFATTAGNGSAYTVNFTPDRTVTDGFSMRANFHTACNATPTISIDGGTPYEIVDGLSLTSGGTYRSLDAGDIRTGMNLVLMYDSSVTKMVIVGGFPLYELSRDLQMNGYVLKGMGTMVDGVSSTTQNLGTVTTGNPTVTLAVGDNIPNKKRIINNGAFTLAAPSVDTNIELVITNGATAGAITLSGFTHRVGDFVTTNAAVFLCSISKNGSTVSIGINELEAI